MFAKTVIVTSSKLVFTHGPFNLVHRKVFAPTPKLVTVEVGEVGLVMVPDPLTNDHWPLAGAVNALACMVYEVVGVQRVASGPALAAGAAPLNTVMTI